MRRRRVTLAGAVILATLVGLQSPPAAQARPRFAPLPSVSISAPAQVFIGQAFSFTVTFDNSDADEVGYGPIVDLIFPFNGADGQAGTQAPDGIDFSGAAYLGVPLNAITRTFPDDDGAGPGTTGCVDHPFYLDSLGDPLAVCGTAGDKLVVIELPFGSLAPDQPAIDINVDAQLSGSADLGVALTLRARGGFRFGADPLDNPCCDLVIVNPASNDGSGWPSAPVTPTLLTLSKAYSGPEDETATGPNFRRQYTISVEIAPGQGLSGLTIIDVLPDNLQFASVIDSSHPIASCSTPSTTTPGGTLSCTFSDMVSGTAWLTFEYFVPLTDSGGVDVLPADSGDDRTSPDEASASASWTPADTGDPVVDDVTAGEIGPEHVLNDRSIAIQKSVALVIDTGGAGPTPGDTLEYSLAFQVSDFFAFGDAVIRDTFSDGQLWDATFAARLSLTEHAATSSGPIGPANISVVRDSPGTGNTLVTFRLSDELISRSLDGLILGGCIPDGGTGGPAPDCDSYNGGPTTGVITFRTVIQDAFTDVFPSGDPSVDQGDTLTDAVTAAADALASDDLAPTGLSEDDSSSAGTTIARGLVSKSIYAVNGVVWGAGIPQVAPRDTVTYRITFDMPASDIEGLRFTDYLPLPVFRVGDPDADGSSGPAWSYSGAAPGTIPASGVVSRGPDDTFTGLFGVTPTVSGAPGENSLTLDYGSHDDPSNSPSTIDLLFTVSVTAEPFADRLFLTNQVRQHEGSTNAGEDDRDVIIQIQVQEPYLVMTKGVIESNSAFEVFAPAPAGPVDFSDPGSAGVRWGGTISSNSLGAAPINSDLSGVDGGDLVSFAIVIENLGSSPRGAFDIIVRDTLPAGFTIPAAGAGLNLTVTRGDGTPLGYTPLGPGGTDADLFAGGVALIDPSDDEGACGGFNLSSGDNIVVLTYDLQVSGTSEPLQVLTNTSTVLQYASRNGGPNFLDAGGPLTDEAAVTLRAPTLAKVLTATNQGFTSGTNVAIGEIATYTLTVTVPEGVSTGVTLTDTLDQGLAFVALDSLTSSSPALSWSSAAAAAFSAFPLGSALPVDQARLMTIDFGTVTNSDAVDATAETITLVYRVVVLDSTGNNASPVTLLNNTAVWAWSRGSVTTSAPEVRVVEPWMLVTKTPAPAAGDAGDTITFTVVVRHRTSGVPFISNATAFDVVWSDQIPAGMTYVPGSLVHVAGLAPDSISDAGAPVLTASWAVFPRLPVTTSTLRFQATLDASVSPGQVIDNYAYVNWTGLPGDVSAPQTPNNSLSTERFGPVQPYPPPLPPAPPAPDDYWVNARGRVTVTSTPQKTVSTSSEAHTSGTSVAIGEIVRYRLQFLLAEGTAIDFMLHDSLPPGLRFLNDDTARAALVANGAGITSSTLPATDPSGNPLQVTGNEGTIAGIIPAYVLPDLAVSASATAENDTYISGTDVYFKFGTLTNGDRDADIEYVVVEFNAVVENVIGSQAYNNGTGAVTPTTLRNRFRSRINGTFGAYSPYRDVQVVEPLITDLTKTATVVPEDAGDLVVLRFAFSNSALAPNAAAAFDITLTDTLDAFLVFQSIDLVSVSGGDCGGVTPTFSGGAAGQLVTGTLSCLNPGGSAVIEVTARVVDDAPIGASIANAVNLVYTSLPGSGTSPNPTGSLPGTPGTVTGERTGLNGVGGLNDYVDSAVLTPALQLIDPAVTKSIFGTSVVATGSSQLDPTLTDLVIGETVTFHITVTLPEGTAPITLTDSLPTVPPDQGILTVLSSQVLSIGANLSGSALSAGDPGLVSDADGDTYFDQVTFAFGNLTNTPDGVENDDDRISVEVVALVENLGEDQNGDVLINQAQIDFGVGTAEASASVEVVEPELALAKAASDDTPGLGERITYTLTLSHLGLSSADANEVVIRDAVPAGLTYVPGSAAAPPGWSVDDSAAPDLVFSGDLPLGAAPAVFIYQADVGLPPSVGVGDVFVNSAAVTWTSIEGPVAGERTGAGGVDDYSDTTSATVTVAAIDLRLTKDDGGVSRGPGETIAYSLTIENTGNTEATGVVITETVPAHTSYDGSPGWTCAPDNSAGSTCTYTLGTLAGGASLPIAFTVIVDDPLPSGITLTTNTASVADDGTHGIEPTPADNADSDTTPLVAAPDLTITKDDGLSIVAPGTPLAYTLTYANVGDQDATGVVIQETVPAGTTFDAGASAPTVWSCADGAPAGTACQYDVGDLPVGGGGTLTFAVVVTDPAGVTQIVNTAVISDDGSNGADQTPADNSATDIDNLVTLPDSDLTKRLAETSQGHTTGTDAAVGEILTYEVVMTVPPGTAPSAFLVDSLDAGLAFVGCESLTASAGLTTDHAGGFADVCANPSVAALPPGAAADQGRQVTFDLGTLDNPGATQATLSLRYQAVVLDIAGNGRGDAFANRVRWTWSGGELEQRAVPVTIVEPTLTLDKTATPNVAPPGAPITIRLTVGQAAASDSDAFDLLLTDSLPAGLTFVGGLVHTAGLAPTALSESAGVIQARWDVFPLGSSSTIEFQAALGNLPAGTRVRNEAALEWTSLPDDDVTSPFALSPYNEFSTERRYDPTTGADFYRVVAAATVGTPALPATGFAPGRVTAQSAPPGTGEYQPMDGVRLVIPALGVDVPVVGVPTDDQGWDLSWLGARAGYLHGTAYPTVPGNSALTAHVYLPDGRPGPFVRLATLGWDDEIIVVLNGLEHIFRVRQVLRVGPDDLSVLQHEEYSWLTLITCQGFDQARDAYRWRVAVRAVLVEVHSP